ncbi:MAG TPA: alpha/beta-type small acid-soluble spore protein [Oscillospiraceae bacterium]|nr:alpha/beta-type small acid-soluble spore protein [Oscillospiraceae bacterium]
MANKNRKRLVPEAEKALAKFKMEIAGELGLIDGSTNSWETALDQYKHEIANELGIDTYVKQKGWQRVPSAVCGSIGGRMGGKIGGNMVKRMIEMAEKSLAGKQ